jgi:integrase
MARPRKPYFRKSDGWWVSRFQGHYVKLAKGRPNEAQAHKRFHELMAVEVVSAPATSANSTTASMFETFLAWSFRENEPNTYQFYRHFLQNFVDKHGAVRVRDLKPYHVTKWLEQGSTWGQSTRRCAVTAVKRALNWAVQEGYLDANPLRNVVKAAVRHRDTLVSEGEHAKLKDAASDEVFREFLSALRATGCRPGEVAAVTATDVDLDAGTWTLKRHKTVKKTKRPRVVFLTRDMVELSRKLMAQHPEGPLFRNQRARPWTKNAIRCRFRRLRKKAGVAPSIVAYAYRHTFATAGLESGVPLATVAELLGHTSTKMVSEHYGHLDQRADHLRDAARQAAGPAASA